MFSLPVLLAVLATAISSVSAHSFVKQVLVGGQYYTGFIPWTDPYRNPVPARIVRTIPGNAPILDISSQDLACNKGGETGTPLIADVDAGTSITFFWTPWATSHKGPVSTYMTSCNGNCTTFSTVGAKWFKIDADGFSNGKWATTKLLENNSTWTSTIPAVLASGQYLIRNEGIGLHNYSHPQYYPSCSQLNVKNGGSAMPSPSELASIPGIYDGIQFPNIYTDHNITSFPAPGPPVVSFASSGQNNLPGSYSSSSSGPSSPSSSFSMPPSSPTTAPSTTPYPGSGNPSAQCKKKRDSTRRSVPKNHRRSSH